MNEQLLKDIITKSELYQALLETSVDYSNLNGKLAKAIAALMPKPLDVDGEYLHELYLEATKTLKPECYNQNAQKAYSELTDDQRSIDEYIAQAIAARFCAPVERVCVWKQELTILNGKAYKYRGGCGRDMIIHPSWLNRDTAELMGPYCRCGGKIKIEVEDNASID